MYGKTDKIRRGLGVLFLSGSVLLLVIGLTILNNSLVGWLFVYYWLACFLFTFLAIGVALLDFIIIRKRIRQMKRELADEATKEFKKIFPDKEDKFDREIK